MLSGLLDLKIMLTNENGTTKEGDSVNLTCVNGCDGGRVSSSFTWFKDRKAINEGPLLYLTNVSSTDSGNYTCSLSKDNGITSGVINIDVECEYRSHGRHFNQCESLTLDFISFQMAQRTHQCLSDC